MAVPKVTDPNDPNFNPEDLLPEQQLDPNQPGYAQTQSVATPGPSTGSTTEPIPAGSRSAPGTPYGTQPGSQDTGIASPAQTSAPVSTAATPQSAYSIPTGLPTPAGFDQGKWTDPNKSDPKYDVGRMVAGGATNAQISAMLAAKYPGYTITGNDTIRDDKGDVYDFRQASGGTEGGLPQWGYTGVGPSAAGASGSSGAGGLYSTGAPGTSATNPYASTLQGITGSGQGGDIEAAIMRLLGRGEAPVDANDPNIAGPTAAYKAQQDTAVRRARNALAERDAAIGLNSGGSGSGSFSSGIQSQIEQEGRDVGSFQAQQMQQELMARRQDVANALQFAQGSQKLQLESVLAQMDDQLKRFGLNQQNNQFYDQFAYNIGKDQNNYDQLLTNYLLQ